MIVSASMLLNATTISDGGWSQSSGDIAMRQAIMEIVATEAHLPKCFPCDPLAHSSASLAYMHNCPLINKLKKAARSPCSFDPEGQMY
jgi:hypothetical protein